MTYWHLSNITQFDGTPVLEQSLFYNDTFLWHYSAPSYWEEIRLQIRSLSRNSTPEPSSSTNNWAPTNFQFASPTALSTNSEDFHACACGTDICYCNNHHPGTPPTPVGIHLWRPQILSRPINSVHYNQQVQTGTSTPVRSVPRTPQVTFHPGFTGFRTF